MSGSREAVDSRSPRSPGRDRTNARGDSTRELILVTAERLFAERGIAAMPLRDIGMAAGQKNNVAVQYHFGDRDNLVRSIVAFRTEFIDELSTDIARPADDTNRPNVTDMVHGFVQALARNITDGNHYLPFLSRYVSEHGGYAGLEDALPHDSVTALRHNLYRMLPAYPERLLEERWQVLATSAIHTLARYQMAKARDDLPAPLDRLLDDLVRFLSAGLEAPVGEPARASR